jgi:ligand-binding sensor domain-containing protein
MQKIISFLILCLVIISCEKDPADNIPVISSLPAKTIKKIVADNNGNKWILTSKGVVSYFSGNFYAHHDLLDINKLPINDLSITNPGKNERIWISTNNGAYEITTDNDKIGTIKHYTRGGGQLVSDTVYTVGCGLNDDLYFGTSRGVCVFYKNKMATTFIGRNFEEILNTYKISSIVVAKNGWVFASTLGGGISRFKYIQENSDVDGITSATTYNVPWANGLRSDTVFASFITSDTCQWFGTTNGVGYHNTYMTKQGWIHYSRIEGAGLLSDTVLSICEDATKKLWFGTNNGLSKFDGTSWTNFTTADKLPNNKINTIALDFDATIWIGTDNGISHYIDNKWVSFTSTLK